MAGSGVPIKILRREDGKEMEELYLFLSRRSMGVNASRGCRLCSLVLSELRRRAADDQIDDQEPNRICYDFGSFAGQAGDTDAHKTYALIFFEYTAKGNRTITLTLEDMKEESSLSVVQSVFDGNTSAAVQKGAIIWLSECLQKHSCQRPAAPSPGESQLIPGRLIFVGKDNEDLRLVVPDEVSRSPKGFSFYLTLSHCWGDANKHEAYSLTTARLGQYRQKIPCEALPATFLDACTTTRALCQKYLWIDSLCIMQDSKEDWSEQSDQMWQIYSNSLLNLSATASRNPDEGLFRTRPEKCHLPCTLFVELDHPVIPAGTYRVYSEDRWSRDVDQGPVNKRAWVLQERLLAPRTLHFGTDEVAWECDCLQATESFPKGVPPLSRREAPVSVKTALPGEGPVAVEHYGLLKMWSAVVERYAALALTFPSDKLIAISSLAQQVALTYPASGSYLAGLWNGGLISQLLWQSLEPKAARRVLEYRAPSWSWACIDGGVRADFDCHVYDLYGRNSVSRPMLRVREASTTVVDARLPFGAVDSGRLRVAGCVFHVRIGDKARPSDQAVVNSPTNSEIRNGFIEAIRAIPNLSPDSISEDMTVMSMTRPEMPEEVRIGLDNENGILMLDGRDSGYALSHQVSAGPITLDVTLDIDEESTALIGMDLVVLPVSCISGSHPRYNREGHWIHSLQGLLLAPHVETQGGQDHPGNRQFRRVGVWRMEDDQVPEFLCALGNQNEHQRHHNYTQPDILPLNDFVPPKWQFKGLDFVPDEFTLQEILIV